MFIRRSTETTIKLGPFVDETDGVTAETGLTITQAEIRLAKGGSDIVQKSGSGGATHDELGYYNITLDTTDTNSAGPLKVIVYESGALPVWENFTVLPQKIYDSLILGTDNLEVDSVQISGAAISAVTTGTAHAVWSRPTAGYGTGGTFGNLLPAEHNTTQGLLTTVLVNMPTQSGTAHAVWSRPTAGYLTGGTFGYLLPSEHNTTQALLTTLLSSMRKFDFVGDYGGLPLFYKLDGGDVESYFALMNSDGEVYITALTSSYSIYDIGAAPLWTSCRFQSTILEDSNVDATPYQYVNGNFAANLSPGFYVWLGLNSNTATASLNSYTTCYFDGTKWWPAEQSIKEKTDVLPVETGIAHAVWNTSIAPYSGFSSFGKFGYLLPQNQDLILDDTTSIISQINNLAQPTGIAHAVWSRPTAGYGTGGTFGNLLPAEHDVTQGLLTTVLVNMPTQTGTAHAVWSRPTAGYGTGGTFGNLLPAEHNTTQDLLTLSLVRMGNPLQSGVTYTASTSNGSLDVTFNV